jgi:hypothetical protein
VNAPEREIIEKFNQLDGDAWERVLAQIAPVPETTRNNLLILNRGGLR